MNSSSVRVVVRRHRVAQEIAQQRGHRARPAGRHVQVGRAAPRPAEDRRPSSGRRGRPGAARAARRTARRGPARRSADLLGRDLLGGARGSRRAAGGCAPALHLVPGLPDVARELGQEELASARLVQRPPRAWRGLALLVGQPSGGLPVDVRHAAADQQHHGRARRRSGSRACPCARPSPAGAGAPRGRRRCCRSP